ncbi:MAG: hypothetical protein MSH22_07175 [Spirochaetia bacterium]|nr:hypothetical protein [Spirochaetia bacterium]
MPFKSVFGLHFGNAINPNVKEFSETAKVQETWFLLKDSSTKVDLSNIMQSWIENELFF